MAILTAYKAVDFAFASPFGGTGCGIEPPEWPRMSQSTAWVNNTSPEREAWFDARRLDYRLGLAVEPLVPTDPSATTPNDTNGFAAYTFLTGQRKTAFAAAEMWRRGDGKIVIIEFSSPDAVLAELSDARSGTNEVWLSAGTVVGLYTPADPVSNGTATTMNLAVAIGAADASVTYSVANPGGTVVAVGTATHASGGTYSFTLAAQGDAGRFPVTWSGVWSGGTRTFTTYGRH